MYRLDTQQQAILDRARSIAGSDIAPHAAAVDAEARFPSEAVRALGEAGLMGLLVPQEFGGMGQPLTLAAAVIDEVAQRCGSTAMVYTMHLCGVNCYLTSPDRFGDELRAAAAGRHLSTLAFSEKGSRSQFWAPVSRAVASGDGFLLSAEKSWVTSAGVADGIVASSQSTDGSGASVFLVKNGDAGLSVSGGWDSLGMRGNQSNPMRLENVKLGSARLIGSDGQGSDTMLGKALPVFLIGQGATAVGLCEAAFAAAQKHVNGTTFAHTGTKLSDLPNQRTRLAQVRIEADSSRAYLAAVAEKAAAGAPDALPHLLAVKVACAEAAVRATDTAMRACGGAAFSKHLGLERAFRDARAAVVMSPTTDHLHEFIGRLLCGMELFG
jgi:alkylation response protein AidB-like acyl-CoA dehydrogenase